jgi:hypothetical protein
VKLKVFDCSHPYHTETTLGECEHCTDFVPELTKGTVRSWQVGLVAESDDETFLQRYLDGLAEAGWSDVRIFLRSDSILAASAGNGTVSLASPRLGLWGIWYLALSELLVRSPNADAYLLLHDSVRLRKDARGLLERELWPTGRLALVSLAGPADENEIGDEPSLIRAGWDPFGEIRDIVPDAAALILPGFGVRSLLSYAALSPRQGQKEDSLFEVSRHLRDWARTLGMAAYYASPSLARALAHQEGDPDATESKNETLGRSIPTVN